MLIASSCSKNFGLYRERTGVLCVQAESKRQAQAIKSQVLSIARQSYSMPPSHGALIAGMILGDESLYAQWASELSEMRRRIVAMREMLVERLGDGCLDRNFEFYPFRIWHVFLFRHWAGAGGASAGRVWDLHGRFDADQCCRLESL